MPDDDFFFDLGGHSLLGAAIVSELAAATRLPLELRDLYLAPTPREFAGYLGRLDRRLGEYRARLAAGFELGVVADALAELGAAAADALLPAEVTVSYAAADGSSRATLLRRARGNGACGRLPTEGETVLIRRGDQIVRMDIESGPGTRHLRITDAPAEDSDAAARR